MLKSSKSVLRLTSNIQSLCQIFIKRHASKSDMIKKCKEDKLVFGTLVETNVQKKKRLKLEKKGKIPQQKPNSINTELLWIMGNSRKNLKKIILSTKRNKQLNSNESQEEFLEKSSKAKDKSPTAQNTKNILNSESQVQKMGLEITNPTYNSSAVIKGINNNHNQTIPAMEQHSEQDISVENSNIHNNISLSNSNLSKVEKATAKYMPSNFERMPNIIIKNLPSFPIMGNKQESSVQSTEILSISGTDYPETINFPSVTKILMQTMPLESKLALEAWKERMIKKLGEEGFKMHQKALLEDGESLHSCIAQNLLEKEYEIPLKIEPVFKSVQYVLKDVHHVRAVETHVAHTKLCYKGVVDCVASYRGENYVIDWKKSNRKKSMLKETYDAPVQIAAYIGAINASNIYPFVIKRGLLVIAYTCGTPATVYEVCDNTLQQYWTAWLHRLQKYYIETTRNDDNKSIRQ